MTRDELKKLEQDESDLHELVDIYRTLKNVAKWLPWVLGIILVCLSIMFKLLELFKRP